MQTIVEPKQHIDKLWGKQRIREDKTYRLMKYVLRVDHEGRVLLHNVVTGRLVVLDQDEAAMLDNLPAAYSQVMEQLVTEHYLVPEGFDEHQQVVNLRTILRKLDDVQKSDAITHYTILPTTACNARCYYCFEQGTKPVTMTQDIADDVVAYIVSHRGNKELVRLSWFGGEPTVASDKIDYICERLQDKGVFFQSDITTNGYLFDEKMVDRAVDLWNLKKAMICFDGTEKRYNEAKAYVNAKDNPYKRVLRNIGLLLDREVDVNIRMNFDIGNYTDFVDLIREVQDQYKSTSHLQVRVHPIVGEYPDHQGQVAHATDEWFAEKIVELGDVSRNAGLMRVHASELPYLNYKGCQACDSRSVTVTPQGYFVRCPEVFDSDQVTGNVIDGITNAELLNKWNFIAYYEKCSSCVMQPFCFKLMACPTKDRCTYYCELKKGAERTVKHFANMRFGEEDC